MMASLHQAVFPGSAIAGYLLMFVTVQSIPVFVAAFSFLIQTLGDALLTIGKCRSADCVALTVGGVGSVRVLRGVPQCRSADWLEDSSPQG